MDTTKFIDEEPTTSTIKVLLKENFPTDTFSVQRYKDSWDISSINTREDDIMQLLELFDLMQYIRQINGYYEHEIRDWAEGRKPFGYRGKWI